MLEVTDTAFKVGCLGIKRFLAPEQLTLRALFVLSWMYKWGKASMNETRGNSRTKPMKRGDFRGEMNSLKDSEKTNEYNYKIIEYFPNVSVKLTVQMLTHKPHSFWLYESSYIFVYIIKQLTCVIAQDIDLREAIILLNKLRNENENNRKNRS